MLTIQKAIKPDAYAQCDIVAYIPNNQFSSIFMSVMKLKQCIKGETWMFNTKENMSSNAYIHCPWKSYNRIVSESKR